MPGTHGIAALLWLQELPQAEQTDANGDSLAVSLDRIGEGVTDTGRLILQGEWDLVLQRTVDGATSLVTGFVPNLISAIHWVTGDAMIVRCEALQDTPVRVVRGDTG